MITRIQIRNFKTLDFTDIELGNSVVFVGPNNCGKTSALQAIALFDLAVKKWNEQRLISKSTAQKRTGVPIQISELVSIPILNANQLWKDLGVRESNKDDDGKPIPKNILIEIDAEGITQNTNWKIGFEFYYAREILLYCRLKMDENGKIPDFPKIILKESIGLLPPMSGLVSVEDKLEMGSIRRKIGEGKTSDILRNLCFILSEKPAKWKEFVEVIKQHFFIEIQMPTYNSANGTISMNYKYKTNGNRFIEPEMDISNLGSGAKQVILLFAFILATENSILLLDEPDAHLEVIRQKNIFNTLTDLVNANSSQLIIATHSESVLNEAAEKADIIAFVGEPHKMNNKTHFIKSLVSIGFDQYLLAEQKKWVLYLEGSTDLAILKAFAQVLNHPLRVELEMAFVSYKSNQPSEAVNHYLGLKEAVPELKAIALFDRLNKNVSNYPFQVLTWQRNEIENYIPLPETLEKYLIHKNEDLFSQFNAAKFKEIFEDEVPASALKNKDHSFWVDTKMSTFVEDILRNYYHQTGQTMNLRKSNFHELIQFVNINTINSEVIMKLDAIYEIARHEKIR